MLKGLKGMERLQINYTRKQNNAKGGDTKAEKEMTNSPKEA